MIDVSNKLLQMKQLDHRISSSDIDAIEETLYLFKRFIPQRTLYGVCPACGQRRIETRFCPFCGQALEVIDDETND